MEASPFPYQGPLLPAEVRGRDELVADLIERVTERRVTALLGPRRYGKTSALRRVSADLAEVTTIWVDLYEVTSMADVAVRFDQALDSVTGRFAALAREIAAAVSVNLGFVRVELTGPHRNRPDPVLRFGALLDVLVETARREPTLLILDEFSSISRVEGATGAIRTALQHRYREIGLVFAGSQPSMMRTLFTARPQPFYGQADLVEIGPLAASAVEVIVGGGFAGTARDPAGIAGKIHGLCRGHPQRTMQLADACWRHTPAGEAATETVWAAALAHTRLVVADGLERLYSGFEHGERDVLRTVAHGGSIYGSQAELLDLSSGSATHARRSLVDQGDLVDGPDGLEIIDPLLADWIRHRFPV